MTVLFHWHCLQMPQSRQLTVTLAILMTQPLYERQAGCLPLVGAAIRELLRWPQDSDVQIILLFGCANQHQASIAGYNCSGCARREQIDSGAAYRACTELLVQL
jgi:hypothetical protein